MLYYGLRPDGSGSWQAVADLRRRANPLWVIYQAPPRLASGEEFVSAIRPSVRALGYRRLDARLFPGLIPLVVVRMSRAAAAPVRR
jgi:hypothetical protein